MLVPFVVHTYALSLFLKGHHANSGGGGYPPTGRNPTWPNDRSEPQRRFCVEIDGVPSSASKRDVGRYMMNIQAKAILKGKSEGGFARFAFRTTHSVGDT